MLIAFILVYLAVTLLIGWWAASHVHSTRDFVVAGGKMPMTVAATALFATWFGSETLMGASAEFLEKGLIGVIEDPFGAALCLVLVGAFFARPLYRMNLLTFSDFFKRRFSRRAELVSAIFLVPSYFGWIAAQLVAMAVILNTLTGIPVVIGIAVCTVVALIYTYIGGMWAVSVTDFVQTIMIVAGLLVLAYSVNQQAGGIGAVLASAPEGFFRFIPKPDALSILAYVAAWITIGLGSVPQQDVFQRVMSAKNETSAVRASYLAGALYLSVALIPLYISLCGRILYPEFGRGDPQMALPQMVLRHGNIWMQIMFFGALLSAILSTTSGAMLAPATVIGENLVRPYFRRLSDQGLLQIMRLAVVGVAFSAAFLAGWKTNIYELVGQSSALSLVSLFVPLAAGLFWSKASNSGAILAMLAGMTAWIAAEITDSAVPGLLWGLSASVFGMVVGSLCKPDLSYENFRGDRLSVSSSDG
ncbi:MAG: sodium:solute symporter family protein [Methylococcaceae bacterium]|nr:sodium:solute symporter family protein [Methylococcaceae bacterium]MCI0667907.1 sodium:solute symporter family protein [Methylococcaceae bacterium]MCI0732736.1 sodium:solute symporter family protein [Methylococcaceae bacterium]